jgi:hypothetical protein
MSPQNTHIHTQPTRVQRGDEGGARIRQRRDGDTELEEDVPLHMGLQVLAPLANVKVTALGALEADPSDGGHAAVVAGDGAVHGGIALQGGGGKGVQEGEEVVTRCMGGVLGFRVRGEGQQVRV